MRIALVFLVLAGCAPEPPTPYQCEAGTPRVSPECERPPYPGDDDHDFAPWAGCQPPDDWAFVLIMGGDPLGTCSAAVNPTAPIACDGVRVGNTACDYGCGWVPQPTDAECEAMRRDCLGRLPLTDTVVCRYPLGEAPPLP
jgi:hypothetical protein